MGHFEITPLNKNIASVFCLLTAPTGTRFAKTIPQLKAGKSDKLFEFGDSLSVLGIRFDGFDFPDENNSMILTGTITIRHFTDSDFDLDLICLQDLEDGKTIEYSLTKCPSAITETNSPLVDNYNFLACFKGLLYEYYSTVIISIFLILLIQIVLAHNYEVKDWMSKFLKNRQVVLPELKASKTAYS
ncbi:hypothetical protein LOD99_16070 [Oopsacas minuta]|uniref:Uncharacterized protein n=1 Tax=Oopsacas minuta TaxID=111878 RepID=A0AAV7K602_9METZ|nr:hypothetical protein LOD99_16070 [Oopsacas minuta]